MHVIQGIGVFPSVNHDLWHIPIGNLQSERNLVLDSDSTRVATFVPTA